MLGVAFQAIVSVFGISDVSAFWKQIITEEEEN